MRVRTYILSVSGTYLQSYLSVEPIFNLISQWNLSAILSLSGAYLQSYL